MTFIWIEMLWLLLLLPILTMLYVLALRRRKKMALRYANLSIVRQAAAARGRWRRHVPPLLFLVAMAALILAVARPAAVVTLASSRATVILAMDTSGSMRAEDVEPSRIEAAQTAARQFIADQPNGMQIGIVSFAASAVLVQAPTVDREALYGALNRLQLQRGTAVGSGVLMSLATIFPDEDFDFGSGFGNAGGQAAGSSGSGSRSLDAPPTADAPPHEPVEPGSYDNAVIILLTDGATTTGPDPVEAGRTAADHGVRVFTVGFGSPSGEIVNYAGRSMRAQLDEESLKTIAESTRGEYFEARTAADLSEVYRSMSSQLVTEKKLTEVAFAFAGAGALFALAAAGLSTLWFGRVI